ncbi:MAG: hypothetical protein JWS12_635 [Candidatus Saccharibacteria bacterium]|nr:hypothetical protein [Candidatus Saccharibacteria bacterium]
MLTLEPADYSEALRQAMPLPERLYYEGDLPALLEKRRLAVVGSRKASAYGKQVTTELVREVAVKGVVIISGLAFGLDSIAHRAALEAGGFTIAVLPAGLDTIYPTGHTALARQIIKQGGALVSEYPEHTTARKHHFIARNRIISALSEAVLIPEAASKSGSLHTAQFALEQGREVLAVPGNITSPLSVGTNNLIRTGATPITSAQDILESLNMDGALAQLEILAANDSEHAILSLLQKGVNEASSLLALSQLPPSDFNQTLTMLEISGKIRSLGGGHWAPR